MAKKYLLVTCPFCNKGKIEALYFPSTVKLIKSTWGGYKPTVERSAEDMIVTTEKCSECGKSAEEIKKAFDGKKSGEITPEEHKKRLKRLKKQGLPTMIVNVRKRE